MEGPQVRSRYHVSLYRRWGTGLVVKITEPAVLREGHARGLVQGHGKPEGWSGTLREGRSPIVTGRQQPLWVG